MMDTPPRTEATPSYNNLDMPHHRMSRSPGMVGLHAYVEPPMEPSLDHEPGAQFRAEPERDYDGMDIYRYNGVPDPQNGEMATGKPTNIQPISHISYPSGQRDMPSGYHEGEDNRGFETDRPPATRGAGYTNPSYRNIPPTETTSARTLRGSVDQRTNQYSPEGGKGYYDLARARRQIWLSVWNSRVVDIIASIIALGSFIFFFNAGFLPNLPYPFGMNLADYDAKVTPYIWWPGGPVLVVSMWGFTHFRRIILIVVSSILVTTGTTHRRHPKYERSAWVERLLVLPALVYAFVMGLWFGWANNVFNGYLISEREFVISGLLLFVISELVIIIGSCVYACRKKEETVNFRAARLVCDFLSTVGLSFVSFTLPGFIQVAVRIVVVFFVIRIEERPRCC